MTFKELLDIVKFEDIVLPIVRMYLDMEKSNLHFDKLHHMALIVHAEANNTFCCISLKKDGKGVNIYLDAFPMKGDYWELFLTKEIVIGTNINASNGSLRHTSFYGFVEKHLDEKFKELCKLIEADHTNL